MCIIWFEHLSIKYLYRYTYWFVCQRQIQNVTILLVTHSIGISKRWEHVFPKKYIFILRIYISINVTSYVSMYHLLFCFLNCAYKILWHQRAAVIAHMWNISSVINIAFPILIWVYTTFKARCTRARGQCNLSKSG